MDMKFKFSVEDEKFILKYILQHGPSKASKVRDALYRDRGTLRGAKLMADMCTRGLLVREPLTNVYLYGLPVSGKGGCPP